MTQTQFAVLCGKYLIEPALALENDKIVQALKDKDDAKVEELLKTEF